MMQPAGTFPDEPGHHLVLITGPSGAGRSTAVKSLEDLGYEAIDNLPISLLPRLLGGPPLERPLALAIDVRNRDFSVQALLDLIRDLDADPSVSAQVLYLDCRPDVLLRRFSETRRRHPLVTADDPEQGIAQEIDLLVPVRAHAGQLIDTSELSPHDLQAEIDRRFNPDPSGRLMVSVQSFSYKRGVPNGIDMMFDCRFLRNPHWDPDLRRLDGRDDEVQAYVSDDPRFAEFFDLITSLTKLLLPAWREEGKANVSIGLGCTGGQHRSVVIAEKLAKTLAKAGCPVTIRHKELARRARSAPPSSVG